MTFESLQIEAAFNKMGRFFSKKYGLISDLVRHNVDGLGPRLNLFSAQICIGQQENIYGAGASTCPRVALVSAAGEALERYSNFAYCPRNIIRSQTYLELKNRGVSVYPFEKMCRLVLGEVHESHSFGISKLKKMDWVEMHSLVHNSCLFFPANRVLSPKALSSPFSLANSRGTAFEFSRSAAILNGLYEIIEGHCFLHHWLKKDPVTTVDFSDSQVEEIQFFLRSLGFWSNNIEVKMISTNQFDVHVFLATLKSKLSIGEPNFVMGLGCHSNPIQAVKKAVSELAHNYIFLKVNNKTWLGSEKKVLEKNELSFLERMFFYARYSSSATEFLKESNHKIKFDQLENHQGVSCEETLVNLVKSIGDYSDVLTLDITAPEIQWAGGNVLRVYTPELHVVHTYQEKGWRGTSEAESKNDFPHPMP